MEMGESTKNMSNEDSYREFHSETDGLITAINFRKKAEELEVEILEKFDVQFHELVDKCAQALEEPSSISKKHTNMYDEEGRKVFIARESLLTELLEVNHIQTIYNIFVALLILFVFNTLVYDFIETGSQYLIRSFEAIGIWPTKGKM